MSRAVVRCGCLAAMMLAMLHGCARPVASPPEEAPAPVAEQRYSILEAEACAARLHAISGALLFYFAMEYALPARLDELHAMPGMEEIESFTCPASGLPYIYNPTGVLIPERESRVILFDAAPSHGNMRWAVMIEEPRVGEPLVTKVIALPESFFLLHRNEIRPRQTLR